MKDAVRVAIVEGDLVWARPGGRDLIARIYRPEAVSDPAAPIVVDVHGGVWSVGDRMVNAVYDRCLAEAGVIVVAIDFRDGRSDIHPAASIDVTNVVRWARQHTVWSGLRR